MQIISREIYYFDFLNQSAFITPSRHLKAYVYFVFTPAVKRHFLKVIAEIALSQKTPVIMQTSPDGGFSKVEPATEEVKLICDKVSSASVNIISLAWGRCLTSTLHKHLLLNRRFVARPLSSNLQAACSLPMLLVT